MSSWNARDNNLHAELRINRLQRMIHVLFEVQGDAPKSLAARGKKSHAMTDKKTVTDKKENAETSSDCAKGSNDNTDGETKGQEGAAVTPRVASVRRGRKRPQWESGTLPVCGRVNLRPLASFFGLVATFVVVVALWLKYFRAPSAHSQALARYRF